MEILNDKCDCCLRPLNECGSLNVREKPGKPYRRWRICKTCQVSIRLAREPYNNELNVDGEICLN